MGSLYTIASTDAPAVGIDMLMMFAQLENMTTSLVYRPTTGASSPKWCAQPFEEAERCQRREAAARAVAGTWRTYSPGNRKTFAPCRRQGSTYQRHPRCSSAVRGIPHSGHNDSCS